MWFYGSLYDTAWIHIRPSQFLPFIPKFWSCFEVGSLSHIIVFFTSFQTKVPFKVLKIRSSFAHYTEVTKVSFLPEDSRFRYEPTKNTPTVLEPFQDTVVI